MNKPRISLAWLPWRVLLVFAVALKVRLSWWSSNPGAAYFPDSMCYWPARPDNPCRSGHSYTVQYLWDFLTNHHMSEHRVLIVQLILGLVSSVIVFATLRLLTRPNIALVLAMVFASIPHLVFMERAILTESIELALVTFGTFAVVAMMKVCNHWLQASMLSLGAATFGLAVSVHAASLLALGLSLAVASVALVLRGHWKLRDSWTSWTFRVALMAATPVLFLAPSLPVFNLHERVYGVSSFNPIANATLVYRWSPIISCDRDPQTTQLTQATVKIACRNQEFFPVPGLNLAPLFSEEMQLLLGQHKEQLGLSSNELGSIAMKAIVEHPVIVVREMSRSIVWQIARERQFDQFEPAVSWINGPVDRDKAYPNWRQWFGPNDPTVSSPFPNALLRVSEENIMLPNHLLWIGMLAAGGRLLVSRLTQRRPLRGWRIKPFSRRERAVLLVALSQIFGLAIAVAYSSAPDPRYWLPFIPTMFVLIALGVIEVRPTSPVGVGQSEILDLT